jgi:hypothetical protein
MLSQLQKKFSDNWKQTYNFNGHLFLDIYPFTIYRLNMKPERKEETKVALTDAAKNWVAMDGLWFQAVERKYGMEAALDMDRGVWEQFAVIEARRIKARLALPEKGGLDALNIAFSNRLVSLLNKIEILRPDEKTLIVTTKTCRVQAARQRNGMAQFPCISVGMIEFPVFARTIDSRIVSTCLSCPPETRPGIPYCSWKFTLEGDE